MHQRKMSACSAQDKRNKWNILFNLSILKLQTPDILTQVLSELRGCQSGSGLCAYLRWLPVPTGWWWNLFLSVLHTGKCRSFVVVEKARRFCQTEPPPQVVTPALGHDPGTTRWLWLRRDVPHSAGEQCYPASEPQRPVVCGIREIMQLQGREGKKKTRGKNREKIYQQFIKQREHTVYQQFHCFTHNKAKLWAGVECFIYAWTEIGEGHVNSHVWISRRTLNTESLLCVCVYSQGQLKRRVWQMHSAIDRTFRPLRPLSSMMLLHLRTLTRGLTHTHRPHANLQKKGK